MIEALVNRYQEEIAAASRHAGRYLGEALGGLSARDSVFMRLSAPDDATWRVRYTTLPSAGRRGLPVSEAIVDVGGGLAADPAAGGAAPRPGETVRGVRRGARCLRRWRLAPRTPA